MGWFIFEMGDDLDKHRIFQLRDHFRQLGHEVPAFILGMEQWVKLEYWDPNSNIVLDNDPFSLELLNDEG